ncbi:hypothetical protein [Streptococcus oralis]|uniref:hypothetical protein n=1 Tax=Streptococcus oralis TaxID=1303 RepID=UPI00097923B2|nr:hypothetical protein [Streptococcus oralis]AQA08062.1 hypothetical protein BWR56_0416 [Streptococcus oralis]
MYSQIFSWIQNYHEQESWFNIFEKKNTFKYNIKFIVYQEEVEKFKHDFSLSLPQNIFVGCNSYTLDQFQDPESENNIILTIEQNLVPEKNKKLFFYSEKDFLEFEKEFLKKIAIKDFKNRESKIKVDVFEKGIEIISPIFSQKNEELLIPKILLSKSEFNHVKICALPNVITNINYEDCKKVSLINLLDLLSERMISDNGENTEFVISFEKNAILKLDDVSVTEKFFKNFENIFDFIFSDDKTYYEKLIIFRGLFSDLVNNKLKIDDKDIGITWKKLKINYNLFIKDKLKKYIDDKKKITEDFTNLQRKTSDSIKIVSNSLLQQILVLIATVLTTFILKNFSTRIAMLLTLIVGLLYLILIIRINCLKGWHFESKSIELEYKKIDNMYSIFYNVEEDYFNKLKQDYKEKMDDLIQVEKWSHKIVNLITVLVAFSILFVYLHPCLYTHCEFYKNIVDFFIQRF